MKERDYLLKQEPWLSHARKVSLKSTYRHQMGCVIVKSGRVLARGYNKIRHRKIGLRYTAWPVSLHAERDALTKIKKEDIKGSTAYIYRETADGKPANAAPCDACGWMLYELLVKRVVHTISEFPYYKIVDL